MEAAWRPCCPDSHCPGVSGAACPWAGGSVFPSLPSEPPREPSGCGARVQRLLLSCEVSLPAACVLRGASGQEPLALRLRRGVHRGDPSLQGVTAVQPTLPVCGGVCAHTCCGRRNTCMHVNTLVLFVVHLLWHAGSLAMACEI